MKSTLIAAAAAAALGARHAAAHATFQALWIDGTDFISLPPNPCARLPLSNSPVTNVMSNDIRCNAGTRPVSAKCAVPAGSTVAVEMHQQPNDRSCRQEAIGGAHHGPVAVYLSKVSDATKADGSAPWFKIFEDSWAKNSAGRSGDDDFWGTKDLNSCCGKMSVPIPSDLAPGDYLLRAEALALHSAGSSGGGQFYMTCYQLSITGTGTRTPAGVSLPGAYSASDPGILVNIHGSMSSYKPPGPAVIQGGTTKRAGSACVGCEQTCTPGSGPAGTATQAPQPQPTGGDGGSGPAPAPTGCTAQLYGQCGGTGWTGCTACASGSCVRLNDHYSQCVA
ncbi:hypothetical protein DL765_001910 [Monosporascus sp. GIB2]|nr:hypothetical protein DL765_001910 [Monosporascus sp. GIB2]